MPIIVCSVCFGERGPSSSTYCHSKEVSDWIFKNQFGTFSFTCLLCSDGDALTIQQQINRRRFLDNEALAIKIEEREYRKMMKAMIEEINR